MCLYVCVCVCGGCVCVCVCVCVWCLCVALHIILYSVHIFTYIHLKIKYKTHTLFFLSLFFPYLFLALFVPSLLFCVCSSKNVVYRHLETPAFPYHTITTLYSVSVLLYSLTEILKFTKPLWTENFLNHSFGTWPKRVFKKIV